MLGKYRFTREQNVYINRLGVAPKHYHHHHQYELQSNSAIVIQPSSLSSAISWSRSQSRHRNPAESSSSLFYSLSRSFRILISFNIGKEARLELLMRVLNPTATDCVLRCLGEDMHTGRVLYDCQTRSYS